MFHMGLKFILKKLKRLHTQLDIPLIGAYVYLSCLQRTLLQRRDSW